MSTKNNQNGGSRLFQALKEIEGLKPDSINEYPITIWLRGSDESLRKLVKIMDRRYGGPSFIKHNFIYSEMCAEMEYIDVAPYFIIRLHSRDLVG